MACGFTYSTLKALNDWYATHEMVFNKIINLEIKKPFEIREREVSEREIINVVEKMPDYGQLSDIEKYICDKWGVYDCKTAIAIAKSESGLKEDAFNTYNTNGTLDVGVFQVNSVHFSKPGCSLKELVDAKKNIDCAYSIYKNSGWGAWSAFNSGAFKNKL
jgi:hypothetical protein